MRNWVLANLHMAQALKVKGYHYQFVYAKEAGHVDRPVRAMTVARHSNGFGSEGIEKASYANLVFTKLPAPGRVLPCFAALWIGITDTSPDGRGE